MNDIHTKVKFFSQNFPDWHFVLHCHAILSVGSNPNPLVRPQSAVRSICDKYRIAVSPDLAPGSQQTSIRITK